MPLRSALCCSDRPAPGSATVSARCELEPGWLEISLPKCAMPTLSGPESHGLVSSPTFWTPAACAMSITSATYSK